MNGGEIGKCDLGVLEYTAVGRFDICIVCLSFSRNGSSGQSFPHNLSNGEKPFLFGTRGNVLRKSAV
jgi:hypothetical protein